MGGWVDVSSATGELKEVWLLVGQSLTQSVAIMQLINQSIEEFGWQQLVKFARDVGRVTNVSCIRPNSMRLGARAGCGKV